MVALAPTVADATVATAKAADLIRAHQRSDPRFAGWMPGAADEQVVGLPEPPTPVGGGWWRFSTAPAATRS